jgi:hypothetical protein
LLNVLKQPALRRLHELKKRGGHKMKKLFYRLSNRGPFARLFSMHARLEERRRVMFSKSSVFAVVALAAFVSLGAILFPQVGQAQECIWDCDLGSDPFNNPGENSPGFSIVYCFDQPCVTTLDTNFNIFTGGIPTASVQQTVVGSLICNDTPSNTIKISGNVIAVAKTNGVLDPASAAEAFFDIVVKKVKCSADQALSSEIALADSPGAVIGGSITILNTPILNAGNSELSKPSGWPGCKNDNKTGDLLACKYPLGNDQSKTPTELQNKWPADGPFALLELYHGNALGRAVSTRMCKGAANQSSVDCKVGQDVAVGGFVADAVFNFDGNWSGAQGKIINPRSSTGNFDIITPLAADIVLDDPQHPVTASANGGSPVIGTSCDTIPNPDRLRCNFPANLLLPTGCSDKSLVKVVVSGNVFSADANRDVKFLSEDEPVCNSSTP